MRYLSWILTIPLALLAVTFSVKNMGPVAFDLWPLPYTVELPAFAAVLGAMLVGFLLGGLVAWMGGHAMRKGARLDRARAARLEKDLLAARDRADAAEAKLAPPQAPAPTPVASDTVPALMG